MNPTSVGVRRWRVERQAGGGPRTIDATTVGSDDGAPLHALALHGGPGFTSESLRPGLDLLAARLPLTLIDLPGCGRSSRHPGSGYPLDDYVRDVAAVIAALRAPRIVLIGHAWGAILATACAVASPSSIAGLVLVNPLRILNEHGQDADAQRRAMEAVDPTLRARFAALAPVFARARTGDQAAWGAIDASAWPRDMFATQFVGRPPDARRDAMREASLGYESYHAHKGIALFDETSAEARFDLCDLARRLGPPVLIVASASDANYVSPPARHARPLHASIPRAKLVVFDGLGHFPFVEAPARFASTVVSWIADEVRATVHEVDG